MEPPQMVADFVLRVDETPEPSAFIRHYNFVDMERYGAVWNPMYINIVRDPIDKVRRNAKEEKKTKIGGLAMGQVRRLVPPGTC